MKFSLRINLLLTGVLMNIVSAILAHLVIHKNNVNIEHMESQSTQLQQSMDELWQNSQTLALRKDFAKIELTLSDFGKTADIQGYVKDILHSFDLLDSHEETKTFWEGVNNQKAYQILTDKINQKQQSASEHIDQQYLEQIGLNKQISDTKQQNDTITMIAVFLQMMGLILVLAKDILKD